MFICGVVSLLFGAFPLVMLFAFLFSICYYANRYDGSANAKHHVIHFADDGGDDEGEPSPGYQKPFVRDNFKFN
jgi:hypothetical protein